MPIKNNQINLFILLVAFGTNFIFTKENKQFLYHSLFISTNISRTDHVQISKKEGKKITLNNLFHTVHLHSPAKIILSYTHFYIAITMIIHNFVFSFNIITQAFSYITIACIFNSCLTIPQLNILSYSLGCFLFVFTVIDNIAKNNLERFVSQIIFCRYISRTRTTMLNNINISIAPIKHFQWSSKWTLFILPRVT